MSEQETLILISKQLNIIIEMLAKEKHTVSDKTRKMGRPTKQHLVRIYRSRYPLNRKMQCARETGLSIKTVSKYWHEPEELIIEK